MNIIKAVFSLIIDGYISLFPLSWFFGSEALRDGIAVASLPFLILVFCCFVYFFVLNKN